MIFSACAFCRVSAPSTSALEYGTPSFCISASFCGASFGSIRCLESHGATLRTDAEVAKVLVESGRAVGVRLADGEEIRAKTAVIGQIHPHLLDGMIDGTLPLVVSGNYELTDGMAVKTDGKADGSAAR